MHWILLDLMHRSSKTFIILHKLMAGEMFPKSMEMLFGRWVISRTENEKILAQCSCVVLLYLYRPIKQEICCAWCVPIDMLAFCLRDRRWSPKALTRERHKSRNVSFCGQCLHMWNGMSLWCTLPFFSHVHCCSRSHRKGSFWNWPFQESALPSGVINRTIIITLYCENRLDVWQ